MVVQTYTPDHVLMSDVKTGFIPQEQGGLIIENVIQGSTIMKLAKNEPMTAPKKVFSFKAKGAGAYWVSETEVIKTSTVEWLTASMTAEKLGVIIPFSKEFLRYTAKDFFNEVKPLIAEAFYETLYCCTIRYKFAIRNTYKWCSYPHWSSCRRKYGCNWYRC
jgi:hypothetical protein